MGQEPAQPNDDDEEKIREEQVAIDDEDEDETTYNLRDAEHPCHFRCGHF